MDYHSDDSSDPETPEGFKSGCGKRVESLRAVDVMAILHEKVAFLSGGRDPRGGPLLTFPACDKREKLKHTDYRPLLHYLTRIPSEEVCELGFTVIVDMRGSTWGTVKPVLKELHLTFAHTVHIVYIIKPDNFWQKQRTSIGSQKYKFETSLMSVGALCKSVDPTQLTVDFDGSLPYDHNTWIELRLAIEEFTACSNSTLDQLESVRHEVVNTDLAEDVSLAKAAVEKHKQLQLRLTSPAIRDLHTMGHRLLQRLQCDESVSSSGGYDSGYSGRDSSSSLILANPDLQACVPSIMRSLSSVETCVARVQQSWMSKKHRLEQCLQLRMLEQDVEKMFDWLYHNREEFLVSYVEIGHTCHMAKHLQESHSQFTVACQKVYLNLNKILSVAHHLIESNHYAAQHIATLATKLDQVWKEFAAGLDERSSVLALSVMFHQKAEQYIESVSGWLESCSVSGLSNDIRTLETNIHLHQQLYETMCQAYTEVHSTSKKLLYQLDHLVQICSQLRRDTPLRAKHKKPRGKPSAYSVTPDGKVVYRGSQQQPQPGSGSGSSSASTSTSSTPQPGKGKGGVAVGSPASDYSEGASHVLAVIHEILAHHRAVEQRWTDKKHQLHQRLALRLFQEDVKQVMDWLATHGEVFLCKNPGVGRCLAKARMYQKSHEHFEMVAQNTYTNAEELLQAAEELAHTGECNPQEIYNVAQQLDSHISSFVARVHQRRQLLQLAVFFYNHEAELVTWLREVVADAATDDVRGLTTIEAAEEALAALQQQQEATEDACANTSLEGRSLLQQLRAMGVTEDSGCGSVAGVEEALDRLAKEQVAIQNVWTARRIKLDLLHQLRLFQRHAHQVLESVEEWTRDAAVCSGGNSSSSSGSGAAAAAAADVLDGLQQHEAEQLLLLHNENMAAVQQEALQALRRGHEIMQLLKTSGLELECDDSSDGEDDEAGDDTTTAATISCGGGPATITASIASGGSGGSDTPTNSGGEDSSGSGGPVCGPDSSSRHSYCSGDGGSSGGSSVGGGGGGGNTVTATTISSGGRRTTRDGLPSSSVGGSDKVSTLVELLHAAQLRLDAVALEKQNKLEQVIQLGHFMDQAGQVQRWIHSGDAMLLASFSVPNCLTEAHAMSQDHQQFQVAIEKTHAAVVQLRERAAQLQHCNSQQLMEVKNSVAKNWENLVTCAEDRHKLVQASIAFYKTAEQVCSVLESLERDYRRDDDWCQKDVSVEAGICDKAAALHLRIEKHQEQKESFLRACTLARKTAQTFLKYANRSLMYYGVEEEVYGPENKVRAILDDLMVKENNVLECWTEKKRTLDQCAQYVELENNGKVALDWITQTGEKYLESHTSLGETKEETEQLLREHNMFKVTAKDTREHVKMILQLADKLVENGHKHASAIREWVARVDLSYKNFSARMDKYRMQLEGRLGICSEESKASLSLDRHSDPSLEHKMQVAAVADAKMEMSEEKRRSARKKELIMKELLDTERTYVKDLEICISCYMYETRQPTAPKALQGKEHIIFCNMEEILQFHKNTFLQELEKYKAMPEDAGHCFVTYAHKFDIYVTYCKAQPESNKLLVNDAGNFYEEVQRKHNVEHPIPAYLIKPVQRITKYQLLLRELLACCEEDTPGEIREGLEVMQNVPKKANDALHLSMLEGCDIPIDKLGDVILQDSFQVWDPRQLLRKHRERHVFLFEHHVVFCKEVKEQTNSGSGSSGGPQSGASTKYQYKQRLVTAELGLSEHSEGDECKFALWGGSRTGTHDSKMILRANSVESKQIWVRKLRQVQQDSYLSNHLAKTTAAVSSSSIKSSSSSLASQSSKTTSLKSSSAKTASSGSVVASPSGGRKNVANATVAVMAATATAGGGKLEATRHSASIRSAPPNSSKNKNNYRAAEDLEPPAVAADRVSLMSFASDSSSGGISGVLDCAIVVEDFTAASTGELSVSRGQYLELLDHPSSSTGPTSISQFSKSTSSSNISSKSTSSNISSKSSTSNISAKSGFSHNSSSNSSTDNSSKSSGISSMCSSSSLIHCLAPRDPTEWAFARLTLTSSSTPQSNGATNAAKNNSDVDQTTEAASLGKSEATPAGGNAAVNRYVIEEGYVPLSVLRLTRSMLDMPVTDCGAGAAGSSSPVAKRKPFNRWLPPQLRKLSHPGRSSSSAGPTQQQQQQRPQQQGYSHASRSLSKVGCVGGEMGNRPGSAATPDASSALEQHSATINAGLDGGGDDAELEVELPPPMRVMAEPLTAADAAAGGSVAGDAAVAASVALVVPAGLAGPAGVMGALVGAINSRGSTVSLANTEASTQHLATELENIVKEKMEQHEGSGTVDALSPPYLSATNFSYAAPSPANSPDEVSQPDVEKEQRQYMCVTRELVDTERSYVADLASVVQGYMAEMASADSRMPDDLRNGKDKIVFGNIAAIFEWHRDFFCKKLEECVQAPEKIGQVFINSEKKFWIYIKYCQNKPKSEYIVSEHFEYFEEIKQKLGHKLQLSDLLIKPVQRLMKYQLLIRDLLKCSKRLRLTEQCESLSRALEIMTVLPRDADHMMTIGRLQDFKGNIMAQGQLLHYGPLLVSEGDAKAPFRPKELTVFLFEQSIIFSECQKRRTAFSSEEYFCKSYLQINKLMMEERCDAECDTKFLLRSTDPNKQTTVFVVQGENRDDHHTWTSQIRLLLQKQRDFLMALQSPIAYQKEQTKHHIDAKTAFEPVGLKGRRISTATSIESFAPSPRLPFEQLSPFTSLPSTDDYHSPITVTEGTSLEGKISPKHRRFSKGAPRRSSAVATAFFYGSNLTTAAATAASASDSSLCHSSSSPSVTQHRWSAGECPPTSCSLNPSPGSPQIPPNSPTSPVNYSTPPSSQVPSGSPSPPKHKRSLLDGFKTGLRPKSRLEADVHSCESHGGAVSVGVGTLVQILQPYAALREDEITVARGEEVQVMSSSARGYLIHRPATSQSPAAEGWVPTSVIQPPAPSPVSPPPPVYSSTSQHSPRKSPCGSCSPNNPQNLQMSSAYPVMSAKKSWMKFRKPSFSKREAKAAAALRKDEVERVKLGLAMQSSGDYGNNSMERYASFDDTSTLSDRNSIGSGSFGGADLYSVSNSSDISISDRLSCGANSSMDYLNTLNRNVISTLDDVSECVIVGDGGDDLLHVVRPLTSMTLTTTGQPVTLTLHIGGSGVQAASVSWFGPSGELENDTRFEQQHLRDGTVSLHLDTCTSADLGRYTCVVTCVDNVASRQLRCSATVSLSS